MPKETIDLLVEGGKAAPGPATAPKLGAYGLDIGDVFGKVNEVTKEYKDMQVPVKIIIDKETKTFEVKVGTPPVSSLIKKELGIAKAKTKAAEEAEKAAEAAAAARSAGGAAGAPGAAGAAKPEAGAATAKEEVEKGKKGEKVEEEGEETEAKEEGEEGTEVAGATSKTATPAIPVEKPKEVIANLTMQQVVKIAKMKQSSLLAKSLKSAVKMIVGTAGSMMGIQVEGKWPKDIEKEIDEGKWDSLIK